MDDKQSNLLSARVERDVRQLIGDLQMQIIVLRGMIDMQQHPQEQPKPPPPPPQPEPPPPEKKEPGEKPPEQRSNGHYQEKIAR